MVKEQDSEKYPSALISTPQEQYRFYTFGLSGGSFSYDRFSTIREGGGQIYQNPKIDSVPSRKCQKISVP